MQPQSSPITYSPISNAAALPGNAPPQLQPQTQAPAAPQESWWQRLMPTGGGVLGSIIGGALAPETGGLSLLAPILGSALGQGAGKVAENVTSGQGTGNGVLSNVVSGGLSGATGEALGAATQGAGGLLSKFGQDAGANAASDAAASAESNAAVDRATAFKNNYPEKVMNGKLQRQWNLGTNADFVDSMGLDGTQPADMQKVAGAGLELNGVVDNALKNASPIDISDTMSNALSNSSNKGLNLDISTTPLGRALANTGITDIPRELPATTVRQLMQSVGDEIGNSQHAIQGALDTGSNPIEEQNNLRTLQGVYNNLRTKLSSNTEVNGAIQAANVSPEDQSILTQKYGPQLANYVTGKINNAQGYDDLVPEMQKFAQMNQASKLALDDMANTRGSANLARIKAASEPTAPVSASTPLGHMMDATGHLVSGNKPGAISSLLQAGGKASPAIAEKTGSLLQRVSKFIPPVAVAAGGMGGMGANPVGGTGAMQPQQTQDPLNQLISANMAQNILAPGPYGGNSGSFLSSVAPQMQHSQMAEALINNLLSSYGNAGGSQGFGGGILSRLSSLIPGTSANAFQGQSNATAQQLAQLLGISPEAAQAMLPQLMQSQGVAGQRMGGLSGMTALSTL